MNGLFNELPLSSMQVCVLKFIEPISIFNKVGKKFEVNLYGNMDEHSIGTLKQPVSDSFETSFGFWIFLITNEREQQVRNECGAEGRATKPPIVEG